MDFADKVAECVEHLALEEFDQEYSSLPEEIQDRLWAQAEEKVMSEFCGTLDRLEADLRDALSVPA